MSWNDGLTGAALNIAGTNAHPLRVMAGPGTGKSFAALRHATEEMQITAVPTFAIDGHVLRGLPSSSQLRQFLSQAQS